MGGLSSGVDDYQHPLEYNDLCLVTLYDGETTRQVSVRFVETSDDGDRWFQMIDEGDGRIRGDDYFSDHYAEVGEIRFICKPDDESLFLAGSI